MAEEYVEGREDCERDKRALPMILFHIVPNYGKEGLPVLVLQSEHGTVTLPISSTQRARLKKWGVPIRRK